MKITDDHTYFKREKLVKVKFIEDFIKRTKRVKSIYDVGCNNGDISYLFQKKYGMGVFGVDDSDNLTPASDYNFKKLDIVNEEYVHFSDVTFFLSLYHHIIAKYSLEVADDIFFKLLLRTKYLVFDTGNRSERKRSYMPWYKAQSGMFDTEKDLLDHFGVRYEVLDRWPVGRGARSVVVYRRDDLDDAFTVLGEYNRRKKGWEQKLGLYIRGSDVSDLWDGVVYYKLQYKDKVLFAKYRKDKRTEKQELENTTYIYNNIEDKTKLIRFYGLSRRYGLIFEWIDDMDYIQRMPLTCGDLSLSDIDVIEVNGERKYIDFER